MVGYNLDEKGGILSVFAIKSPAKILKPNDIVEVRHSSTFQVIRGTVMNVNDTSLNLSLESEIHATVFYPEDPVVVHYTSSQDLYVMGGELSAIEAINPVVVNVRINKIEKMKDLRKSQRYYVSLAANIKILGIIDPVFSIIKNISLGGVKLYCKESVLLEDILDLVVPLDKSSKLNFKGKVVRKNKLRDFFEYGIEIMDITESNLRNLHHYLNQLEFGS
ncbi:MAG: PilZ domain-containing protein [Clostridia bacterium]|nr:PilZ domain-containing protein [Clostridia bacterium]